MSKPPSANCHKEIDSKELMFSVDYLKQGYKYHFKKTGYPVLENLPLLKINELKESPIGSE